MTIGIILLAFGTIVIGGAAALAHERGDRIYALGFAFACGYSMSMFISRVFP